MLDDLLAAGYALLVFARRPAGARMNEALRLDARSTCAASRRSGSTRCRRSASSSTTAGCCACRRARRSARAASTRTSARRCRSPRRSRYCERVYARARTAGAVPHHAVRAARRTSTRRSRARGYVAFDATLVQVVRARRVRPSAATAPASTSSTPPASTRSSTRSALLRGSTPSSATRIASGWSTRRSTTRALIARVDGAAGRRRARWRSRTGWPACSTMVTAPDDARARRRDALLVARCSTWAWEHGARAAYLQVDARQRAGDRRLPQVRLRDRVHLSLPRRGRANATERPMRRSHALAARRCGEASRARAGWLCATAESCTGGLVAGAITDIAGSSDWFDRGFVTYSNEAKIEMLGVPRGDARARTVRCREATARAMAEGALARSRAHVAVAVTGIAGPGGGTPDKPVGIVCFAWARAGRPATRGDAPFPGRPRRRCARRRWWRRWRAARLARRARRRLSVADQPDRPRPSGGPCIERSFYAMIRH